MVVAKLATDAECELGIPPVSKIHRKLNLRSRIIPRMTLASRDRPQLKKTAQKAVIGEKGDSIGVTVKGVFEELLTQITKDDLII